MPEVVQKMLSIIFSLALIGSLLIFLSPAIQKLFDEQSNLKSNEEINLEALEILTEMSKFNSSILRFYNSSQNNNTFRFNPKYQWKIAYTQLDNLESVNNHDNWSLITIIGESRRNNQNLSIGLSFEYNFHVILYENPDANKLLRLTKFGGDIIVQN